MFAGKRGQKKRREEDAGTSFVTGKSVVDG